MQNKYSNQRLTLSLRKNQKKCKESSKKLKNKPNQNCNIVMFTKLSKPETEYIDGIDLDIARA